MHARSFGVPGFGSKKIPVKDFTLRKASSRANKSTSRLSVDMEFYTSLPETDSTNPPFSFFNQRKQQTPKAQDKLKKQDLWRYVEFRLHFPTDQYEKPTQYKRDYKKKGGKLVPPGTNEATVYPSGPPADYSPNSLASASFVDHETYARLTSPVDDFLKELKGFVPYYDYLNLPFKSEIKEKYDRTNWVFHIDATSYARPPNSERNWQKNEYYEDATYQSKFYTLKEQPKGSETIENCVLMGYLPFLTPYVTYGAICQVEAKKDVISNFGGRGGAPLYQRWSQAKMYFLKRICTIKIDKTLIFGHFRHMIFKEMTLQNSSLAYQDITREYRDSYKDYLVDHLNRGGKLTKKDLEIVRSQSAGREFPLTSDFVNKRVLKFWSTVPVSKERAGWAARNLKDYPGLNLLCSSVVPRRSKTMWGVAVEFETVFEYFPLLADYLFVLCANSLHSGANSSLKPKVIPEPEELRNLVTKLRASDRWKCCFELETLKLSYPVFGPLLRTEDGEAFPFDFSNLNKEEKRALKTALGSQQNKALSVAMRSQKRTMFGTEEPEVATMTKIDPRAALMIDSLERLVERMESSKNT